MIVPGFIENFINEQVDEKLYYNAMINTYLFLKGNNIDDDDIYHHRKNFRN